MGKFLVKEVKTGRRFNLVAGNGEVIGVSEVYAPFNWWGDNNGPKIRYAITSADYWVIMLF